MGTTKDLAEISDKAGEKLKKLKAAKERKQKAKKEAEEEEDAEMDEDEDDNSGALPHEKSSVGCGVDYCSAGW